MSAPSPSRIITRQATAHAKRLLAAQSRLYTDAKRIHDGRLLIVFVISAATIVAALAAPSARQAIGVIGGLAGFLWSVLTSAREKRCRREAANVQEAFDTHVFELPWKDLAADRPSPTLIAEAAARYTGNRLDNWYPDTKNVARPLDVLICQRSNLGWGSSVHRLYAATLTGVLVTAGLAAALTWLIADLSTTDGLTAIVLPLLGPVRELADAIRANRDSSDGKAKTELKILKVWEDALNDEGSVTIATCRDIQDRILAHRQSNAQVPDWIDAQRRDRHEAVMRTSADHLIEQARQHGRVT